MFEVLLDSEEIKTFSIKEISEIITNYSPLKYFFTSSNKFKILLSYLLRLSKLKMVYELKKHVYGL
jgi:hypothetical protein